MIDEDTLDKIRYALPRTPFRTGDLALTLRMDRHKLAFMLGILKRLGEVRRFEVWVQVGRRVQDDKEFLEEKHMSENKKPHCKHQGISACEACRDRYTCSECLA